MTVLSEPKLGDSRSVPILKTFVFAVLAFSFVFGTFYLDRDVLALKKSADEDGFYVSVDGRNEVEVQRGGSTLWDRFSDKYILKGSETIKVNDSSGTTIHFPKGSLIRLDSGTEVTLDSDSVHKIYLNHGKLWVNTLYTSDEVSVIASGVSVLPFNSVSEIDFAKDSVFVYSHKGHVRVSFYEGNKYLNSLLVTEGNRIDVGLSKLQEKLSKVLYSKLIKEFHYGKLSDNDKSVFYSANVSADLAYASILIDKKRQDLRDGSLHNVSLDSFGYTVKGYLNLLNSYIVFDGDKEVSRLTSFVLNHLYDAEHLFAYFSSDEAKNRLQVFEELISSYNFSSDPKAGKIISDALLNELKTLYFAGPESDLFELRDFIRDIYLRFTLSDRESVSDHFYIIRTYLNDVFSVIDTNPRLALTMVDKYYEKISVAFENYGPDAMPLKNILIEENQIFDNLLLRSDALYKDKYFGYKSFLEEEWLSSLTDKTSKSEEERVIVSKKISFLKKLREYFMIGKVSIDDAKDIIVRLFDEVEKYRSDMPSAAVDEMFAENLSDLGVFWDFLNAPEYSVSLTYGTSLDERYKAFLSVSEGESGIESLRKKIYGEDVAPVSEGSIFDTESEVKNLFSSVSAEDVSVTDLNSFDQRFVDVSGIISGLKFFCTYDRVEQFLTNIVVDNEILSSGIKIDKLKLLIDTYKAPGKKGEQGVFEGESGSASFVQVSAGDDEGKIAKVLLSDKLKDFGFEVDKRQITVLDLNAGLFEVSQETSIDSVDVKFTFILSAATNTVTKIVLHLPDFDKEISANVQLDKLTDLIKETMSSSESELEEIPGDTL